MAGIDTSALMSCSFGNAGFMLTKSSFASEPTVQDGDGRTLTHARFEGEGFFDDTDAASFAAKLSAIQAAMASDGQLFQVTGLNGQVLFTLPPAACLDGGPNIKFTISDGASPLHNLVKFTVTARMAAPGTTVFRTTTSVTPDGLVGVKQSGKISGVSAGASWNALRAAWQAVYGPPNYVTRYNFENNAGDSLLSYSLEARQCANPMPSDGAGDFAVEGELTNHTEIDEQHRMLATTEYNFLIEGDPAAFHNSIRNAVRSI